MTETLKILEVHLCPNGGLLCAFTIAPQKLHPSQLAWGEVLARVLHQAVVVESEKLGVLEETPPAFFKPAISKALLQSFKKEVERMGLATGEEA